MWLRSFIKWTISTAKYYQRHSLLCHNEPPTYYSAFIEQVCGRHGNITTTTMKLMARAWSIFDFDRKQGMPSHFGKIWEKRQDFGTRPRCTAPDIEWYSPRDNEHDISALSQLMKAPLFIAAFGEVYRVFRAYEPSLSSDNSFNNLRNRSGNR